MLEKLHLLQNELLGLIIILQEVRYQELAKYLQPSHEKTELTQGDHLLYQIQKAQKEHIALPHITHEDEEALDDLAEKKQSMHMYLDLHVHMDIQLLTPPQKNIALPTATIDTTQL